MRDLSNAHWRDSAREPRFFFVNAQAAYPFLIFLLHIRWWTFFLCLAVMLFFSVLEKFGLTFTKFFRICRVFIVGKYRYRKGWWE